MRVHGLGLGLGKFGTSSKALGSGFARCARMGWAVNEVSTCWSSQSICIAIMRFTITIHGILSTSKREL